jgi:hypothetical protein
MTDQRATRPAEPPLLEPRRAPDEAYELCYECRGDRTCLVCDGTGERLAGGRCLNCHGSRWCIVWRGSGQLPAGAGG